MNQKLAQIRDFIFGAKVLNFLLPALMVYLVAGTIAQKYVGLYAATEAYFFAPVFWLGGELPLPGVPIILAVLLFCLVGHLIFKSPLYKNKLGIFVCHLGVVSLVGAGLFSSFFVEEGSLVLSQGQTKSAYADYHQQMVSITDSQKQEVASFPFEALMKGDTQALSAIPFPMAVQRLCQNCGIVSRIPDGENEGQNIYFGMAQHMQLVQKPLDPQAEANLSGVSFSVPTETGENAVYLILDSVPVLPKVTYGDETYTVKLAKKAKPLPFKVELIEFKRDVHPGTELAAAYQSKVRIIDGDTQWEGLIQMNDPLRYKGYALFQASFNQMPNVEVQSVLAVVYNPYRIWPYYATGLIALGILIHIFTGRRWKPAKMKKPKAKVAALALAALLSFSPTANAANASESLNVHSLNSLPILHEGRVKPLETFAQTVVADITGTKKNATKILALMIFAPQKAAFIPLIEVKQKATLEALDLPIAGDKHYAFNMLQQAFAQKRSMVEPLLAAEPKSLTANQAQLVEAYKRTQVVAQLLASLTVLMPLEVRAGNLPPEGQGFYSYADWLPHRAALQNQLKQVIKTKGENVAEYTADEQALAMLSFTLAKLQAEGQYADLFKVIPVRGATQYASPWEVVNTSAGTPQTAEYFAIWQDLAKAYRLQNSDAWMYAMHALQSRQLLPLNLRLELVYNSLNPVMTSLVLYLLGLMALAASGFVACEHLQAKLIKSAAITAGLGAFVHVAGVALRIVILQRPPVGTLYESVLFVGGVMALFALWRYVRSAQTIWLWLLTLCVALLQILALSLPQSGDNMTMLVAVLNTNFWLTIHVLTITAGYGFCLLASGLAHACLWPKFDDETVRLTMRPALRQAVRWALLLTFVGTLLGGVWADQSWGRFWGWDPKENGALLIVLWIVWLLHAEVARTMSWRFVVSGYVLLSGVVATSWLGVNLLSVGLHNYGFTSAMAIVLGGVWAAEFAFLAWVFSKKGRNA